MRQAAAAIVGMGICLLAVPAMMVTEAAAKYAPHDQWRHPEKLGVFTLVGFLIIGVGYAWRGLSE